MNIGNYVSYLTFKTFRNITIENMAFYIVVYLSNKIYRRANTSVNFFNGMNFIVNIHEHKNFKSYLNENFGK